ncbi:MAG: tRNA adenosine(34) deaminase TadA [Ignavibacteria bacterium]|nr:tRNA adenosine(34) deaminase TadA [Ignavibacteria bacterium]
MDYEFYMKIALKEAKKSLKSLDVPVGALIVKDGEIVSLGHNEVEKRKDPTYHAEFIALRKALKKTGVKYLYEYTLFTTLEPCPMCAGALVLARIGKVVFAAYDPKSGAGGSVINVLNNNLLNHRVEVVSGILQEESSKILKDFFQKLREQVG